MKDAWKRIRIQDRRVNCKCCNPPKKGWQSSRRLVRRRLKHKDRAHFRNFKPRKE